MSHHPIVHFELSASDRRQAGEFYDKVFGWEIDHQDAMNYTMFGTGEGQLGGGFNPVSEGNPAGTVIVYIGTDDIDDSLKKVGAHGGSTLQPKTEIPGFGWFGLFRDPSGNVVGLYTAMGQ